MARSLTSLGDDDGSIDTCNTADSPTTVGSRSSRPGGRRQRRATSPAAKVAETPEVSDLDTDDNPRSRKVNADAAADMSDAESQSGRGSRRVKPVAANGMGGSAGGSAAAAAAAAAAQAAADDARGRAVSPVMPTPPRAGETDVIGHAVS